MLFINCPFDIDYALNLQAIIFTVYRCGFFPISALSEDNALDNRRFGYKDQKSKNALIFEKTKFTYQNYLPDLNGIDTKAHNNNTSIIIQSICDWLKTSSKRAAIPGHVTIIDNF